MRKMPIKRLFIFAVLLLTQACAVSMAQDRLWASIGYEEEVLTETYYTILVVGSKFGITQILAVAEGLCQYKTNRSYYEPYLRVFHRQYLSNGGGLIPHHIYIEGVAFDRYKFWDFYIFDDGTEQRSLLPDLEGEAANPPYYSISCKQGWGVGDRVDLSRVVKGGLIINLYNMSVVFVDGSQWTWNNTTVTITYEASRVGELWVSNVSLNTTLPLQNVYNEATNTLTIYMETLPTLFWIHTLILTVIIIVPTVIIVTVIWRKTKERQP